MKINVLIGNINNYKPKEKWKIEMEGKYKVPNKRSSFENMVIEQFKKIDERFEKQDKFNEQMLGMMKDIKSDLKDVKKDLENVKIDVENIKIDLKNVKIDVEKINLYPLYLKRWKNIKSNWFKPNKIYFYY